MTDNHIVYVLQRADGCEPRAKVGITKDVSRRFPELERVAGCTLESVGIFFCSTRQGARDVESATLRAFRWARLPGSEWFRADALTIAYFVTGLMADMNVRA